MELTRQNVVDLGERCLFPDEESSKIDPENLPEDAVVCPGVMHTLVFKRERLEAERENVVSMLEQLPDEFFVGKGGGWSLINMVMLKDKTLWGEQRDADLLYMIASGLGLAKYVLPRDLWSTFYGGMPYVVLSLTKMEAKDVQV